MNGSYSLITVTKPALYPLREFGSIDINRGVLYTAKLLTINPGKVINDYLKGKTKKRCFYNNK